MRLFAVPSGTCERSRDLVRGQPAPVGEDERLALGGREPRERVRTHRAGLVALQRAVGRVLDAARRPRA